MFWIGFASGTAAAMLIMIASISAMAWGVGKDRGMAAKMSDKYWQQSLDIQTRNAETFERIEDMLSNK